MDAPVNAFEEYASVYADAPYSRFAADAATSLRALLDQLRLAPTSLLDLACGPGDLAAAMSSVIPEAVGLDRSAQMIEAARRRTASARQRVGIVRGDIRAFAFTRQFDLITCTFNTLNYLTTEQDFRACLTCVATALAPGGHFVFDLINEAHLRTVIAGRDFVLQNCPRTLEVWQNKWIIDNELMQSLVTVFVACHGQWSRLTETHLSRVWPRTMTEVLLAEVGLTILRAGSDLSENSSTDTLSERTWYICRRTNRRQVL